MPQDPNSLQLDGDLLIKLGRTEEAIVVYTKILAIDPVNRSALDLDGLCLPQCWRRRGRREIFSAAGGGLSDFVRALSRFGRHVRIAPGLCQELMPLTARVMTLAPNQ